MKKRKFTATTLAALLLFLAGIACIALGAYSIYRGRSDNRALSLGTIDGDILVQIPAIQLPDDVLYISHDRRRYGGGMRLVIPAIGVDTAVGGSTLPEGLRRMPGLYEFSQMPGEEDGNVSIAGHRDIYNMVFYNLHKLGDGDLMYLIYEDNVYTYEYEKTAIVQPTDWSVIKRREGAVLTLTTCDPIGATLHRMVVTGKLAGVTPYTGDRQLPGDGNTGT